MQDQVHVSPILASGILILILQLRMIFLPTVAWLSKSLTALALVAMTLRLKVRIMRSKSVLPIFSEIQ